MYIIEYKVSNKANSELEHNYEKFQWNSSLRATKRFAELVCNFNQENQKVFVQLRNETSNIATFKKGRNDGKVPLFYFDCPQLTFDKYEISLKQQIFTNINNS